MTFVTALALLIGFLAIGPYVAHRFRRVQTNRIEFAPVRMLQNTRTDRRKRSKLEHRALLSVRMLVVIALALLGASPFVRCTRLSVDRAQGASIAMVIVIDDSLSMRARHGTETRFLRAKEASRQVLDSLREGDMIAVIAAGKPARLVLSLVTNVDLVRKTIKELPAADRATDLEGALSMAQAVLAQAPQTDKRVTLLSDLADGHPNEPLPSLTSASLWVPLNELAHAADDCAILSATSSATSVSIDVACNRAALRGLRDVVLLDRDGKERAKAPLVVDGTRATIQLPLASDASRDLRARLTGSDANSYDDELAVATQVNDVAVGLLMDRTTETVETGGAPILEQAISALHMPLKVRSLSTLDDQGAELRQLSAIAVDDAAGFTPEQRRAFEQFFARGGSALLALGSRSAQAQLGYTFEPMLLRVPRWLPSSAKGANTSAGVGAVGEAVSSWDDLHAKHRSVLAHEDVADHTLYATWVDGAPLVTQRAMGRGSSWVVTLPFSAQVSDLPLTTGFLALLYDWLQDVRSRLTGSRTEAGATWTFTKASDVRINGPAGPVEVRREGDVFRADPSLVGSYEVKVDEQTDTRIVGPPADEVDLSPRKRPPLPTTPSGGSNASIELSPYVALSLLVLLLLEMILRQARRRDEELHPVSHES